jgi:hypothetical protein
LLVVDGDALAHLREGAEMLVFDLVDVAKALAQFEHSSEVVAFDFVGSQEATEQFEQATEVQEVFLVRCLHLCVDCLVAVFGHGGGVALPSNMVDARLCQMVPLVVGGCYEPLCDTLP